MSRHEEAGAAEVGAVEVAMQGELTKMDGAIRAGVSDFMVAAIGKKQDPRIPLGMMTLHLLAALHEAWTACGGTSDVAAFSEYVRGVARQVARGEHLIGPKQ